MATRKVIWTPKSEEPEINHALAASSALNLKLCHMVKIFRPRGRFSLVVAMSVYISIYLYIYISICPLFM